MNWFISRHERWLEKEVERLHAEVADLKKAHAEELAHAITVNDRLRDELQKTRILLSPALANVALSHEYESQKPDENLDVYDIPTGTPWMRLQAQYAKEQAKQADNEKAAAALKAAAAQGESNGVSGQVRTDAS